MSVGIVVLDFQLLAEMRERVDIVAVIGLAVAPDVFDHLAPHAGIALDREIDFLQIDRGHLADVFELENFELEHEVAGLAVVGDADAEGSVDEAEAPEFFLAAAICALSASKYSVEGKLIAI